jgi:putative chitinase
MPYQASVRLTSGELARAVGCSVEIASIWLDPINGASAIYSISTPQRLACWLATIAHETSGLTRLQEDLNYSARRLVEVWPVRFGPGGRDPEEYARNPEKLANFVYANRMGNGDEDSGDGWRFIGRGPAQLTGRENYERCGTALGVQLWRFPDLLIEPPVGALSAGWYWSDRNLNPLADDGDFEGIVRKWNGGLVGLEDRLARLETARGVFA